MANCTLSLGGGVGWGSWRHFASLCVEDETTAQEAHESTLDFRTLEHETRFVDETLQNSILEKPLTAM